MEAKVLRHPSTRSTSGRKELAVLVDLDKSTPSSLAVLGNLVHRGSVEHIFVGGSLMTSGEMEQTLKILRENCEAHLTIFPGSINQISSRADALFLLSLISGRNADLLIGKHVEAAPSLKRSGLEWIPTGYMLVDGGQPTTASYMSNTFPIPRDKEEIAMSTAMAGEMLELQCIYLDAESGAQHPIPEPMIESVKNSVSIPLIVGCGMRTQEDVAAALTAGADDAVVGNAFEHNPELSMAETVHQFA